MGIQSMQGILQQHEKLVKNRTMADTNIILSQGLIIQSNAWVIHSIEVFNEQSKKAGNWSVILTGVGIFVGFAQLVLAGVTLFVQLSTK